MSINIPELKFKTTPVNIPQPKNIYYFVLLFEHGDADLLTKEYLTFLDYEEANIFYYAIKLFVSTPQDSIKKEIDNFTGKEILDKNKVKENKIASMFRYLEFWPYDTVYEGSGCLAKLESVEVYYYNSLGEKFEHVD